MADDWPDNVDGDVLRSMKTNGFDFAKKHEIDFNIDLPARPSAGLLRALRSAYPQAVISDQSKDGGGDILVQVSGHVTYEFVCDMQNELSEIAASEDGVCEAWGVLYDPNAKH